jgi:alpha/beta superfamily hydrolase
MYPARSFRVYRAAAWLGIREPAEAIALIEPGNDAVKSPPVMPTLTDMTTKADAVRFAIRAIAAESTGAASESTGAATDAQAVAAWLRARAGSLAVPAWEIPAAYVRDVARRDAESTAKQRRSMVRAIGAQDSGRAAAGT